jgi:hypothetical protein
VTTIPNVNGTSTITIAAVNGFTGTVTLAAVPTSGLTANLNVTIITGSGSALLTVKASLGGTYSVTVTGTAGTLVHSVLITVNVQDFAISPTPGQEKVSVSPGGSVNVSINVASLGGFAGTVNLTPSCPTGLTCSINPSQIMFSGSATLTIAAGASTPTGTFLVNVTGTGPSTTHQTTITVTVISGVSPPSFSQMLWVHRLSIQKLGGVQTWRFGILNTDNATTIYAAVRVTINDGPGVSQITLTTQVFTIDPSRNLLNLSLSHTFTQSPMTFSFTAVILWGTNATTDPSQLPFQSTSNQGVPVSGSFTVLP